MIRACIQISRPQVPIPTTCDKLPWETSTKTQNGDSTTATTTTTTSTTGVGEEGNHIRTILWRDRCDEEEEEEGATVNTNTLCQGCVRRGKISIFSRTTTLLILNDVFMPGWFVRSSWTTSTNKSPLFQTSRTREAMANQLAMKKTQLGLLRGFRSSSSRLSQLLSLGAWWRRSTGKGGILCPVRINPNIYQNILILSEFNSVFNR